MLRTSLIAVASCFVAVGSLHSDIVMRADNYTLLPDTPNQSISVFLSKMSGDPDIVGANVNAQIVPNNSFPASPVFQGTPGSLEAVNFSTGTAWTSSHKVAGSGPASVPEFVTASVTLDDITNPVSADGVLVHLSVNTTGVHFGTFDLLLESDELFTSNLILPDGGELVPTIQNGSITINAIPEPAAFVFMGTVSTIAFVGIRISRRRQSRLHRPS